jgi:hypothetical protein
MILSEFEYHDQFKSWDLSLRPVYKQVQQVAKQERDLARILDAVYRRYMEVHTPSATQWGDKTPLNTLHLEWIDRVFPEAKYVHMIRDGRDVVSSYVQAGLYSNVESAARRWRRSITVARHFGNRNPDRYLEVRYELFVRSAEKEARRICAFLDLDFHEGMLRFQDDIADLGDTHLPHHRGLRYPINTNSIGKWAMRLSIPEKNQVRNIIGDKLENLGYLDS